MKHIYLDDTRIPTDKEWELVKDYSEFVKRVEEIGLDNIAVISLDHDLGDSAMQEYHYNVAPNYKLDYDNITEKTGYDCAKWLVQHWMDINHPGKPFKFPQVYTHSANPIGSANIMGYINNFFKNQRINKRCTYLNIEHSYRK